MKEQQVCIWRVAVVNYGFDGGKWSCTADADSNICHYVKSPIDADNSEIQYCYNALQKVALLSREKIIKQYTSKIKCREILSTNSTN